MNKSALLKNIAICSTLILPFTTNADTSNKLYGDFRYSLNQVDDDTISETDGENNGSFIGLKGEYSEDGLTAFYNFQTGVNIDGPGDTFTTRFYYAGIKGKFGKIQYGRATTAYKQPGLAMDIFYDTPAGLGFASSNYGLSKLNSGWTDDSLIYYSPKINGFTISAGVYLDDSDADEHDTSIGLLYEDDAFDIGVQYLNVNDTGAVVNSVPDSTALRIHAGFKTGAWTFGGSYEVIDLAGGSDQEFIYLVASYQMSNKLKLKGGFGSVSDYSASKDGTGLYFSINYQLLKKTEIYALFSTVDFDKSGKDDRNVLSVGVSHKFSLGQ